MTKAKHDPMQTVASLRESQWMSIGSELERQAAEQADQTALSFEDRYISFGEN